MTADTAWLGEEVRICHKRGRVTEVGGGSDSVLVSLELGGVHQDIVVTEDYVRENLVE